MIATSWWHTWVWPANGSGGIPGDVVGTLYWVVLAGIVTSILWPPARRRIHAFLDRKVDAIKVHVANHHAVTGNELAEMHRKLDHLLRHTGADATLPPRPTPQFEPPAPADPVT